MNESESINNINLIENGLIHIRFELERNEPSFFRIACESHLLLYRGMIEVLKGSANIEITGRPSKSRQHKYYISNPPWKEIHKEKISGCDKAWRFSKPVECEPPEFIPKLSSPEDFLISFYDALAMIQSECFMKRSFISKTIFVPDEEMKALEWLHENVRNEYEHFKPELYGAPIFDLGKTSIISLILTKKLIFETGNVRELVRYKYLDDMIIDSIQKLKTINSKKI